MPPGSFLRTVNVYLIQAKDGYMLVDAGHNDPGSWQSLHDQLAQLHVPANAIHTVLVTHGHPDHVGLAGAIRAEVGAQVWMHQDEVPYRRCLYPIDQDSRSMLAAWYHRFGFPASEADALIRAETPSSAPAELVTVDRPLAGGEELVTGPFRFRVEWTPGHTPGHVCLYEPERRLLLTGDHVLREVAPNVGLQPGGARNPLSSYLGSLHQLSELGVEWVLPGHGTPFGELRARTDELLRYHQERRQHLLGLLTAPLTPYELAARTWADARPNGWSAFHGYLRRNAVALLAAHLELLVEQEQVVRHPSPPFRYVRA